MSNRTYSLTEIVGTSTESVDNAVRNGLKPAAATVRNLDWFTIQEIRGVVDEEGSPSYFQVTMKVGFRLEEPDED
ncbi:dodecin [Ammonicoccus fulvus]|uniref:Dodecin n=1 Tax=Ammonicoccus fulvus TaxID=3138240 RepID=A0ABZ3FPZ2_9ACTN